MHTDSRGQKSRLAVAVTGDARDEATLRGTDAAVTGQRVADGDPAGTPAIPRESEKKFSKTFCGVYAQTN